MSKRHSSNFMSPPAEYGIEQQPQSRINALPSNGVYDPMTGPGTGTAARRTHTRRPDGSYVPVSGLGTPFFTAHRASVETPAQLSERKSRAAWEFNQANPYLHKDEVTGMVTIHPEAEKRMQAAQQTPAGQPMGAQHSSQPPAPSPTGYNHAANPMLPGNKLPTWKPPADLPRISQTPASASAYGLSQGIAKVGDAAARAVGAPPSSSASPYSVSNPQPFFNPAGQAASMRAAMAPPPGTDRWGRTSASPSAGGMPVVPAAGPASSMAKGDWQAGSMGTSRISSMYGSGASTMVNSRLPSNGGSTTAFKAAAPDLPAGQASTRRESFSPTPTSPAATPAPTPSGNPRDTPGTQAYANARDPGVQQLLNWSAQQKLNGPTGTIKSGLPPLSSNLAPNLNYLPKPMGTPIPSLSADYARRNAPQPPAPAPVAASPAPVPGAGFTGPAGEEAARKAVAYDRQQEAANQPSNRTPDLPYPFNQPSTFRESTPSTSAPNWREDWVQRNVARGIDEQVLRSQLADLGPGDGFDEPEKKDNPDEEDEEKQNNGAVAAR